MANKYKRLRRQYSTNGVNWTDLQPLTYRVGDLIEENSYCSARIYQDFVADPLEVFDCEDGNKYYVHIYQYSDNDGATWVTYKQERDALYETLSEDCGVAYRWEKVIPIDEGYMCENSNKYYKIQKEYSVNGVDWIPLNEYQKGDLYESNSEDCGYIWQGITEVGDLIYEFEGTTSQYRIDNYTYTATESPVINGNLGSIYNCERTFGDLSYPPRYTYITKLISFPDTSNVYTMNRMFNGCTKLKSLDLSNFNTSNVTDMSHMFKGCSGLTSLNISNFDTSKVTDMTMMFLECSSLTSLDLSNFNTSKITSMNGMFADCSNLTYLDLSGWRFPKFYDNGWKSADLSDMFNGCTNLETIVMNDWTFSDLEYWGNLSFVGCDNLKRIYACGADDRFISHLRYLSTVGYLSSTVEIITNNCDDTTGSTTSTTSNVLAFEFTGDTATYKLNDTTYTATTSPYSVTLDEMGVEDFTNASSMFASQSNLTKVTSIPDTSNVTEMSLMFYGCRGLTSLDVSNFNTSNVTDMGQMFMNSSKLTSIILGNNFDTSNVTSMNYMFYGCSGLTSLDVSNFDTSNVTEMNNMFGFCRGLTSLDVSNFDTSNVTEMWAMFYYCTSLTSLDLSNFDTSKVTFMASMFNGCSGLTSLDVSNFDTSNVTEMSQMFDGCPNLRTIYMRNCNTTTISKIEQALSDAGIRDNVTIITN